MNKCILLFVLMATLVIACRNDENSVTPDPLRFAAEIREFQKIKLQPQEPVTVFTGSSSIRMWESLTDYYPAYQVVNTGFGGSQMSDLLYYLEGAVLRFRPNKVFIYEGDNDVAAGQSTLRILYYTRQVLSRIEQELPDAEITLIAAKPSPSRWHLKSQYEALNREFKELAAEAPNRHFADVWSVMLDEQGVVRKDIFLEDELHMNEKGYALWDGVLRPLVERG